MLPTSTTSARVLGCKVTPPLVAHLSLASDFQAFYSGEGAI